MGGFLTVDRFGGVAPEWGIDGVAPVDFDIGHRTTGQGSAERRTVE